MTLEQLHQVLGSIILIAPAWLVVQIGGGLMFGFSPSEKLTNRTVLTATVVGLLASLTLLASMLVTGERHVLLASYQWVTIPHYHFSLKFVFDRLSVPFVILTYLLCGTISAFTHRYLHREPGFQRFFLLFALFFLGMMLTTLAGAIETLFFGWELVGLSSTLLVAFFYERVSPVENGLRVWLVYRVADAALLAASILMHHLTGEGDFDGVYGAVSWPEGVAHIAPWEAFWLGLLLLIAAIGKSALLPLSGWLPRAMEGPTPSSAVFYGALSVHLGAFLLLRASPLFALSPGLCAITVFIGISTAAFAALVARVQTDIKSTLAFASLTQVGLIVAEIGLGFRYVALVHILGHASLRTLQFLRAPNLLRDYLLLEKDLGRSLPQPAAAGGEYQSSLRRWLYHWAIERGYFDVLIHRWLIAPFLRLLNACDQFEDRAIRWLNGDRVPGARVLRPHDVATPDVVTENSP